MELVLMRHAESQHNVAKNQVKLKYCTSSVKNTRQYNAVRIDPSLRDQPLTQQGVTQSQQALHYINWDKVELILVSPMKRCLETCHRMLSKIEKKIEVRAEPLLKGRLSNIWGYGSSVNDLKMAYPEYIFENLTEQADLPWFINVMSEDSKQLYRELSSCDQKLLLNFREDYGQFRERVGKLKALIEHYSRKLSKGANILIITHSCVLRTMTAHQFDIRQKGISCTKFKNAKPVLMGLDSLFQWPSEGNQIKVQSGPGQIQNINPQ